MIYAIEKGTKRHTVIGFTEQLDRSDWTVVHADADGWIPHDGQECPLPDGTRYETKHRDGSYFAGKRPETFHGHWCGDVIAYRPILDARPSEPEAAEWDGQGEPEQFEDVEIKLDSGEWVEGTFLCRHDGSAIVATQRPDDGFNYFWRYWVHIRPIRSEEEKQIEAIAKATGLRGRDGRDEVARNLYAAGCRMTKQ